jgi:ribokinase
VPDRPNILVVGSINMDMVVRAPRMPAPGETILGSRFVTSPGGKGANQAVSAARLGAQVTMVGRVGEDDFGRTLLGNLREEGIDCTHVLPTPDAATGVAMILVDAVGENAIVVAGGANRQLTPDDIYPRRELFEAADAVLLQLELPLPTVRAAIDLARRDGCKVILDPAPAPRRLPAELCRVDVISPNISEAEIITGTKAGDDERADRIIAADLIARGAKAAVLKLAARGALVVAADGQMARVPAYKVDIVDTTAAGDAFTAALAVGLAEGRDLPGAAKFANAAGALACTKLGAQSAMPTADEVRILMADQIGRQPT